MLSVRDVDVFYEDIQALWSLSLEVREGEIVALLGSNGAGKTTTLRTISRLIKPRSGSIYFGGVRIDTLPPYAVTDIGVGHVPEGRRLFPLMTVWENLELGARKGEARLRKAESYEMVYGLFPRLAERRDQLASTLSGGEQQMLAVARALMVRPKLLMLDEPSLGLAPMMVQAIFDAVKQINQQGVAVLLVEQNVQHALRLAHRAYVLENGRVALQGPSNEVMGNEHVRKAYLGL